MILLKTSSEFTLKIRPFAPQGKDPTLPTLIYVKFQGSNNNTSSINYGHPIKTLGAFPKRILFVPTLVFQGVLHGCYKVGPYYLNMVITPLIGVITCDNQRCPFIRPFIAGKGPLCSFREINDSVGCFLHPWLHEVTHGARAAAWVASWLMPKAKSLQVEFLLPKTMEITMKLWVSKHWKPLGSLTFGWNHTTVLE